MTLPARLWPESTVVATSEALIESARTTVTDSAGRYRIEGLRPGIYELQFSLDGWKTCERQGVELTGSLTAIVNARLVGRLLHRYDHRRRRTAARGRAEREARGDPDGGRDPIAADGTELQRAARPGAWRGHEHQRYRDGAGLDIVPDARRSSDGRTVVSRRVQYRESTERQLGDHLRRRRRDRRRR